MAKTVLLTGVTGFLGGATACRLLHDPHVEQLTLLVRATSVEHAKERVRKTLARFVSTGFLAQAQQRLRVVAGDLLDARAVDQALTDDVTHVVHAAANTSLRSVTGVKRTNVFGTLTLAHAARRLPRIERFLHVGTAYACGVTNTSSVREAAPTLTDDHLCEYTRSKAECEWLLERTAPDLPTLVARPSVVVGHTRLGCAPSASIFWYYDALARLGVWPKSPEHRKDVVPVDYVADALHHLLMLPAPRARIYHVSAGEAAEPWSQIVAALGYTARPRTVSLAELLLASSSLEALRGGDDEAVRASFEGFARFSALAVETFDNSRLLAEGMPPPPRFSTYVALCKTTVQGRALGAQANDDA